MRAAIISILIGFVGIANAAEVVPSALTKQLAESIESLSNKLEFCRANEKTLNSDKLQALGLNQDELKVVLAYQFSKLHFECSKEEYVDYLIVSKAVHEFTSQTGKGMMKKLDRIVASSEKYRWHAIERYNELPDSIHKKVNHSDLFNEPFNLIDSLPLVSSSK